MRRSSTAGTWFAGKIRAKLSSTSSAHLTGKDVNDLVPTVLGAVTVQSVTWWLRHDRPCSAGEIADRTADLPRAVIESELRHQS